MITTFFIIVYCIIAFIIDHLTWRSYKDQKALNVITADVNEKILRVGVFVGSLLWPVTLVLGLINEVKKK